MENDVFLRLRRVIKKKLKDVSEEILVPQAGFIHDLGADSLDFVEIIMSAEEEFSIQIPLEADGKIETIGDLKRIIEAVLRTNNHIHNVIKNNFLENFA